MEVKYVSPAELVPYAKNAKQHPPEQVERIANSIKRFGWQQPIVVDRDNVVIIGHGRLFAAKELMLDSVPVVYADNLTEDEVNALRLADNKTNESPWDFGKLEEELAALDIAGIDMTQFGFEVGEDFVDHTEITEDEPPEVPEEPKTKRGEIYRLGNHRLMCGDSTSVEDIETLMCGETAALLLTDPPYGIMAVERGGHNDGKKAGNQLTHDNIYKPVIGDKTTDTAKTNYEITKAFSKDQVIFGGNYFTEFLPPSRCWIVWDKVNGDFSFADGELAWCSFDKNLKIYKYTWSGMVREGSREVEGKTRVHPTQKPVGMLANILKDFTEENDLVLDCFGGSGSTLIACEQTGRKCYMMELDPHYVDVIIQRWENLTGQKAELIQGVD